MERLAVRMPTEIIDAYAGTERDAREDFSEEQLLFFAEASGLFEELSEKDKTTIIENTISQNEFVEDD